MTLVVVEYPLFWWTAVVVEVETWGIQGRRAALWPWSQLSGIPGSLHALCTGVHSALYMMQCAYRIVHIAWYTLHCTHCIVHIRKGRLSYDRHWGDRGTSVERVSYTVIQLYSCTVLTNFLTDPSV